MKQTTLKETWSLSNALSAHYFSSNQSRVWSVTTFVVLNASPLLSVKTHYAHFAENLPKQLLNLHTHGKIFWTPANSNVVNVGCKRQLRMKIYFLFIPNNVSKRRSCAPWDAKRSSNARLSIPGTIMSAVMFSRNASFAIWIFQKWVWIIICSKNAVRKR